MITLHSLQHGDLRVIQEGMQYLFCAGDVAVGLGYHRRGHIAAVCRKPEQYAYYRVKDSRGRPQSTKFISQSCLFHLLLNCKSPRAGIYTRYLLELALPDLMGRSFPEQGTPVFESKPFGADPADSRKQPPRAPTLQNLPYELPRCCDIRETAAQLKIPENSLLRYLLAHAYLYSAPTGEVLPYETGRNNLLFRVRKVPCIRLDTVITPEGQHFFEERRKQILEEDEK